MFPNFSPGSLLKTAVRAALTAVPPGTPLPVLSGPLKGARWSAHALGHSCWLGTYERQTQARMKRLLREGDVFYDIGANAGYFTLIGARLVGSRGAVVAFEPVSTNVETLRRHLVWNRVRNATVVAAAVANADGEVDFIASRNSEMGHLANAMSDDAAGGRATRVPSVTIDALVADGRIPPPDVLKLDVEGAELMVLEGSRETLRRYRPRVLVELHTPEMDRLCPRILDDLGFRIEPFDTWPGSSTPRGGLIAIHDREPRRELDGYSSRSDGSPRTTLETAAAMTSGEYPRRARYE